MNQTLLTTARWELLNRSLGVSAESKQVLLDLLNKEIGYEPVNIGDVDIVQAPVGDLPSIDAKAKVAICIGHSRAGDSGAVAINGISEHRFNVARAKNVKHLLDSKGIESHVIDFYQGGSYSSAMQWLANHLERNEYTLAIELHFNSASPSARGYEYLFWHKSKRGILVAKEFQSLHGQYFPSAYDRGVEPIGDEAHERGVLFVSLTHCPAIICEPFFGSNKEEVSMYMTANGSKKLEDFYADAIARSLSTLKKHG